MSSSKKRQIISNDNITNVHKGISILAIDANTGSLSYESFRTAYDTSQAVYIPNVGNFLQKEKQQESCSSSSSSSDQQRILSWRDIHGLFASLSSTDRKTWCVENAPPASAKKTISTGDESKKHVNGSSSGDESSQPGDFLASNNQEDDNRRGYCSFIVQNDTAQLQKTLRRVPMENLPLKDNDSNCMTKNFSYGPGLWFFFGRNNKIGSDDINNSGDTQEESLEGRPEHTDSVSHDGTWHYQLSGRKIWYLRPTEELLKRTKEAKRQKKNDGKVNDGVDDSKCGLGTEVIECREGDVLIINTRLWWHRTEIPPQYPIELDGEKVCPPSVSYARDIYLDSTTEDATTNDNSGDDEENASSDPTEKKRNASNVCTMTNVDGVYAANDIEEGTIIFKENDMPDCEIHRSSTPNCKVVQLEDGTGAVVSFTFIKSGEFFCVEESDDSDDGEYEEEEEGDWESEADSEE